MSARPVPVPAVLTIAYVVMTAEPLDRDDLVPPPRKITAQVAWQQCEQSQPDDTAPTSAFGLSTVGPGAARLAAEEALQEAIEIATRHDGLVVDLQTPRIVELTEQVPDLPPPGSPSSTTSMTSARFVRTVSP